MFNQRWQQWLLMVTVNYNQIKSCMLQIIASCGCDRNVMCSWEVLGNVDFSWSRTLIGHGHHISISLVLYNQLILKLYSKLWHCHQPAKILWEWKLGRVFEFVFVILIWCSGWYVRWSLGCWLFYDVMLQMMPDERL